MSLLTPALQFPIGVGSSTKNQSAYVSFDSGSKISNQKSVSLPLFDFSYRNFLQGAILNSCFVSVTMTPQVFEQSLFLLHVGMPF